ncbi:hypothetical protein [Nocardia sp. NPDC057227]|uniref:hypothetical protein n=1 Tax=Nocardia sp. NPDC057227 TaxID=3346056 RepID=UPI00363B40FF
MNVGPRRARKALPQRQAKSIPPPLHGAVERPAPALIARTARALAVWAGSTAKSPRPEEPDIWLTLAVGGVEFEFIACLTAALIFVCDLERHRCADRVQVSAQGDVHTPRLPNESLFLEP